MIQVICSDCYDLTPSFLRPGMFLCHGNSTKTTYRSTLVNPFPTTTSARLVGIIQSWVSSNPAFILDDLLVRVPPHISLQSPTHLNIVPPHILLQFPTHLTMVPPHISLQYPHTSHYSSPTHLTTFPHTHLTTVPHTSHYSSPTHLTTVSPHISLQFPPPPPPPLHFTTVPPHISLHYPHSPCVTMSAGESQWRLPH